MKNYTAILSPPALFLTVILTSVTQAQTCNPNIPLTTPSSEYTDHGDGTVTHHRTGLIWKKCLEGLSGTNCTGTPTTMTWNQALEYAGSHWFAGYEAWRLPNIKELTSILETACYTPAINLSIFPNDPGSRVWSSSPQVRYSNAAWTVNFDTERSSGDGSGNKNLRHHVRLVRSRQ